MKNRVRIFLLIICVITAAKNLSAQNDSIRTTIEQLYKNALLLKNSNPTLALEHLVEAEKLTDDSYKLLPLILKEQAYLYLFSGKTKLAEEKFNKAIITGNQQNDEITVAECYLGLGNIAFNAGNLANATNYYLTALKTFEKTNDTNGLNSSYSALADLYFRQNNFSKAIEFQLKAVKLFEGKNDKLRRLSSYENIGNWFYRQNKLRDAEFYYNKALQLFKETGNKAGESYILQKLGDINVQLNQIDKALILYGNSLAIAKQFNAKALMVQNLIDIATCYYKQENYASSEKYFQEAIKNAKLSQMNIELEEAYEGIALVYAAVNKRKDALAYSVLSKNIKDSLFNDSALKAIANLQLLYENEKKHNQIELLKKNEEINQLKLAKQKQINNYLYALIILLLLLIVLVVYYNIQKAKTNRQLQLQYLALQDSNQKIIKQKEELTQLNNIKDRFFTIISHDLRNNLATMKLYFEFMEGRQQNPETIQLTAQVSESVQNTIDLLENLLVWASNQIKGVPLKFEKLNIYELVEENINLMNATAAAKEIIIINDTDEQINAVGDKNTIKLIIRNLLNNAIKFTPKGGEVAISAIVKNNEVEISVTDNGIGISNEKLPYLFTQYIPAETKGTANEKGTGLGLMLCKEFVEKNNGKIWVTSTVGKGSTFSFTLPVASGGVQ